MDHKNDRLFFKSNTSYLTILVLLFLASVVLLGYQCVTEEQNVRFYVEIALIFISFSMNVFLGKFGFYTAFIANFMQFLVYVYEHYRLDTPKPFSFELIIMTLAVMAINLINQYYIVKITGKIIRQRKNEVEERSRTINKKLEEDLFKRTQLIVSHEAKQNSAASSGRIIPVAADPLTTLPSRVMISDRIDRIIQDDIDNVQKTPVPDANVTMMHCIYLALRSEELLTHNIGHKSMDLYIQNMAHKIRAAAFPKDLVARISGAEFLIFTTQEIDEDELSSYIQKLKTAASKAFVAGDEHMAVGFSTGISRYPDDGRFAGELITKAEEAMARSAESPSEQIRTLNMAVHENHASPLTGKTVDELYNIFENALTNHDIYMVYQPSFNCEQELMGFEAFIRLKYEGQDISPKAFLISAENSGYMRRIGNYSLSRAMKTLTEINKTNPNLTMSINLSAVQLKDPDFFAELSKSISDSGCDINNLIFDIQGESLYTNLSDIKSSIEKIKSLGIKIALDNFGRAYSSFNTIPLLPINILKLDGRFLKDLKDDINVRVLSSSVISLMHDINIKVCATGVEDEDQLMLLADYGCDFFQGNGVRAHLRSAELADFINNPTI